VHAECVARARALFDGHRSFDAIAVTAADRDGPTPCGLCRQTLIEYCDPSLRVYADQDDDVDEYTLGELLPAAFTGADIE
jgi:cytidine deaminase